mmetsp:Transcript_28116/g.84036  ORF Transcript_28116/g.84036 Transcript_28116/m.84036 type:complete len:411 (+) Transcript_28116:72-1304(+)
MESKEGEIKSSKMPQATVVAKTRELVRILAVVCVAAAAPRDVGGLQGNTFLVARIPSQLAEVEDRAASLLTPDARPAFFEQRITAYEKALRQYEFKKLIRGGLLDWLCLGDAALRLNILRSRPPGAVSKVIVRQFHEALTHALAGARARAAGEARPSAPTGVAEEPAAAAKKTPLRWTPPESEGGAKADVPPSDTESVALDVQLAILQAALGGAEAAGLGSPPNAVAPRGLWAKGKGWATGPNGCLFYRVMRPRRGWRAAQSECKRLAPGATLAEVPTPELARFVAGLGVEDGAEGRSQWVNGVPNISLQGPPALSKPCSHKWCATVPVNECSKPGRCSTEWAWGGLKSTVDSKLFYPGEPSNHGWDHLYCLQQGNPNVLQNQPEWKLADAHCATRAEFTCQWCASAPQL